MKRLSLFFLFILIVGYFISCTCKGTIECQSGNLAFKNVGFSVADLDSAIFIAYKADNNFDIVIDTIANYQYYSSPNDSLSLHYSAWPGNDYKLIFPTVGMTYTITKLQITGNTTKEVKYQCEYGTDGITCMDNLYSYNVNGQSYTNTTGTPSATYNLIK